MTPRTKAGCFVQTFFKGIVVILYFISYYLSEPIFLAACLMPSLYGLSACLFLRFGGAGRMIVARDRAKRQVKKGVISGEMRDLFYKKCIKGLPSEARAAYALFAEGKTEMRSLALSVARSVRVRKEYLKGGVIGVGILSALSVFLTFYFVAPIEEALLRAAICGFLGALGGLSLHFILYAHLLAAEKAAVDLAELADGSLLREKKEETLLEPPTAKDRGEDEETLLDLKTLLRDLDEREREKALF